MDVYWLEQTWTDIPLDNSWLCSREATCAEGFRFAKRRTDWRLGRWTAKVAVAAYLGLPANPETLAAIEIRAAPSGAPGVFVAEHPAPVAISISHRAGRAICGLALIDASLGCDLEVVEARSNAFIADYFTPEEQHMIACATASDHQRTLALLWSAKESALKALHEGLRLDTRTLTVRFEPEARDGQGWAPLHVRHGGQFFHGWWQQAEKFVRTIVSDPSPALPVRLEPRRFRCASDPPQRAIHDPAHPSRIGGLFP